MEFSALIQFTLNVDGPAHRIHDVFCDRHSKAGAFGLVDSGFIRTAVRFVYPLQKFRGHADPVVFHFKVRPDKIFAARGRLFKERKLNGATLGRIFGGIGQKVQQNLVQADAVAIYVFHRDIFYMDVKVLLFGFDLRLYDADNAFNNFFQRDCFQRQGQLSAFDFGHVQHIVDEPKQMPARQRDFAQTVLHLLTVVYMRRCDGSHAHDRVHRRADIMAHIGQKFAFGLACLKRRLAGLSQLLQLLAGQEKVPQKDQRQEKQDGAAGKQSDEGALRAQVVDAFVQHAVRHHRDEVPLGVRQRLAVDLQAVSARVERYGVIFLFFQRRVKSLKRAACRGRGRQRAEISNQLRIGVGDHKAAVRADDMAIDQSILIF